MRILHRLRQLFSPNRNFLTPLANHELKGTSDKHIFCENLLTEIKLRLPELQTQVINEKIIIQPTNVILECKLFERTEHPNAVVHSLGIQAFNANFPEGITERFAGIGANGREAFANGAHNYVTGVLVTIIDALSAQHSSVLNFSSPTEGKKWHPVMGELQVQGFWNKRADNLDENHFLRILKEKLMELLDSRPYHWLRIYVSRQPNGEIISDCNWDNESWPDGLDILRREIETWDNKGEFAGQKQFMMFRQCGIETGSSVDDTK